MKARGWHLVLGGALLLILAYATAWYTASSPAGKAGTPVSTPDSTVIVAPGRPVVIDAGKYVYYYLKAPSANCRLTGRLETAGDPTFDALLFNEAEFNKWTKGRKAKSTGSGPVSSWVPSLTLPKAGVYYLVVRNLLPKRSQTVAIQAQVTCARP